MRLKIYIIIGIFSSINWGSTGHRVIAEVASNYLTDNARLEINKILNGETLVNASTHADDIKSDSRYDKYYNWHFLNMELDDEYEEITPSERGDVFIAINKCIDILESDSVSNTDKSFYLKLLVHFIGDLHQPLHIGRYQDRGANRI